MKPSHNFLIGIRNESGTFTLIPCNPDAWGSPKDNLPHLSHYKSADAVRDYIRRIEKDFHKTFPSWKGERAFEVASIEELQNKLLGDSYTYGHVYIWFAHSADGIESDSDGIWTCAEVTNSIIAKPFIFDASKSYTDFAETLLKPTTGWLQANYYGKAETKAEDLPRPALPRLSKADWLKQHYPELTELPKWRFPGMVAV
jgi:hypothetical protein